MDSVGKSYIRGKMSKLCFHQGQGWCLKEGQLRNLGPRLEGAAIGGHWLSCGGKTGLLSGVEKPVLSAPLLLRRGLLPRVVARPTAVSTAMGCLC
jgi:hypothetical protein